MDPRGEFLYLVRTAGQSAIRQYSVGDDGLRFGVQNISIGASAARYDFTDRGQV